jgi:DNA-directed RNA polymerase specialized sigma24 family protein
VSRRVDLDNAMKSLTGKQRDVIFLIYASGFSAHEVALITGKSERSVYYLEAPYLQLAECSEEAAQARTSRWHWRACASRIWQQSYLL